MGLIVSVVYSVLYNWHHCSYLRWCGGPKPDAERKFSTMNIIFSSEPP